LENINTIVKYSASPYNRSEIILNCLYILFYNWFRMVFYCCSLHAEECQCRCMEVSRNIRKTCSIQLKNL